MPAVTVPSGRKTGSRAETASKVVPARGLSSWLTVVPSGRTRGVISRDQKPDFWDFSARFWDLTAYSSWACREMPRICATFSAVWPMAM